MMALPEPGAPRSPSWGLRAELRGIQVRPLPGLSAALSCLTEGFDSPLLSKVRGASLGSPVGEGHRGREGGLSRSTYGPPWRMTSSQGPRSSGGERLMRARGSCGLGWLCACGAAPWHACAHGQGRRPQPPYMPRDALMVSFVFISSHVFFLVDAEPTARGTSLQGPL
jgi:hypothetical protein